MVRWEIKAPLVESSHQDNGIASVIFFYTNLYEFVDLKCFYRWIRVQNSVGRHCGKWY